MTAAGEVDEGHAMGHVTGHVTGHVMGRRVGKRQTEERAVQSHAAAGEGTVHVRSASALRVRLACFGASMQARTRNLRVAD